MKFVIQRVSSASVRVDGSTVGKIGKGYMVLVGIGSEDDEATADRYVKKLLGLRIFADENDKTNLSLMDVGGELLIISQFTLYADCTGGNRPSFTAAGKPERAKELYEYIVRKLREQVDVVEKGVFGEHMEVELINDGPFTVVLENIC